MSCNNKCKTCVHKYEPKPLNFSDLLRMYDKILIPKIQRDYAQGRNDKKTIEIRRNLLDDIFLQDKAVVNFNFIYGTCERRIDGDKTYNCYIPLDGQQRLTTLFLLYLYDAICNNKKTDELKKFSYETRQAAKEFCEAIVREKWNIINNKKISETLKNATWFMSYWQHDPTVMGMLKMLDSIQEKANKNKYPDLDKKIIFYFFDINEQNLNESLYLKMNSRGKPLTVFENIKVGMDEMLSKEEFSKTLNDNCFKDMKYIPSSEDSFNKKWQYCIDRDWTDFFWKYKDNNLIDKPIVLFISNFLAGYWAAYVKQNDNGILGNEGREANKNSINEEKDKVYDNLLNVNIDDNNSFIPFKYFRKVLELTGAFENLAKLLCDSCNFNEIIKEAKPYWNENESYNIFKDYPEPGKDYKKRAAFFGFSQYVGDYNNVTFKHWMHFIWNIIENNISDKENYTSFCKLIGKLCKKIKQEPTCDILQYLNKIHKIETFKKNISDFAEEQIEEEIVKAEQIIRKGNDKNNIIIGPNETEIEEAEKYAFFKGAIRFLYREEYNAGSIKLNWDKFHDKFQNAKKYFDENGVKESYRSGAILLKALISRCANFEGYVWGDKYIFDNEAGTWKNILINKDWIYAVNDILIGNTDIKHPITKLLYRNLYETDLLDYVSENMKGSRLRWIHDHPAIYPPRQEGILLYDDANKYNRNKLLSDLNENNTLSICDKNQARYDKGNIISKYFYINWDINFTYKEYNFQWYRTDYVYLMNKNWDYEPRNNDSKEELEKFYCFDKDFTNDNFTEKLDNLINEFNNKKS